MIDVPARVLLYTLGPTALALAVTAWVTGLHRRLEADRLDWHARARTLAPFAGGLAIVLLFNAYVRPRFDTLSPAFGINLTDQIYLFEGYFVPRLQAATPEPLLVYFAAIYVVGYAVLLLFPPLAYVVLDDLRHAKTLFTAYALNYLIGALVYIVVNAYGPRNRQVASGVLYEYFPEVMYLTSAVNSNSNVFPSLHASMAIAVLALAFYSRREYPRWFAVTAVVSPSVLLATMVLGIHWLADVIAGVALALISVLLARWLVPRLRRRHEPARYRAIDHVRS